MKNLGREKYVQLYTTLVKARTFEEQYMELSTQGRIPGWTHIGIGQEAIGVGVCIDLRPTDYIFNSHRGRAHSIAKGIDIKRLMAELFGKRTGFCKGKSGEHFADMSTRIMGVSGIIGAPIAIASGTALACKYRGNDQIVVCFFGDGGANQGTFHESLNMASLWKLPIVFCCENNGWAQFTPQWLNTAVLDIAGRAVSYGMPGEAVDGDEVLAVYRVAQKAINRARKGEGPSLIECKTHRWYGHYGGDSQPYRDVTDVEGARKFDPVLRFETMLLEEKLLNKEEMAAIKKKVKAEIEEAVSFAEASPLPAPEEAMDDVYFGGDK